MCYVWPNVMENIVLKTLRGKTEVDKCDGIGIGNAMAMFTPLEFQNYFEHVK